MPPMSPEDMERMQQEMAQMQSQGFPGMPPMTPEQMEQMQMGMPPPMLPPGMTAEDQVKMGYLPPGYDEAKMKEEYEKFLELQKDPKFMEYMKEQEEAYKKMLTDMYGLKLGEKPGDKAEEKGEEEKKPKKKRKKRVKRLKQEGDKVIEEDVEVEMELCHLMN